jgi:hypothetical protein
LDLGRTVASARRAALFINFFTLAFAFIKALDVIMQEPADSRRGD